MSTPSKGKGGPVIAGPPACKERTIVYGLAKPSRGQIREAERLWREFQRTGKKKHRVAYDKHVAAMFADRPSLTREDRIKRLAWEHAERLVSNE
jgi:hypothetical protein